MGKLIKILVVLGLIVAGVVVAMQYAGQSEEADTQAKQNPQTGQQPPIQPQEKYGFAPMGEE
jgi:flagellar basal body-associated protein FliL